MRFLLKCFLFLLTSFCSSYGLNKYSLLLLIYNWQVRTGWFSERVLDCFRVRVAVRFLSIYPKTGAEKILKACSDEFEKLKRACIYKDLSPDLEELRSKG